MRRALLLAALAGGVAGLLVEVLSPRPPQEAPVVVRIDLTQEAMDLCALAYVRWGFGDPRDYTCRVERRGNHLVVALYGPDYGDSSYIQNGGEAPYRRLGELPLSSP